MRRKCSLSAILSAREIGSRWRHTAGRRRHLIRLLAFRRYAPARPQPGFLARHHPGSRSPQAVCTRRPTYSKSPDVPQQPDRLAAASSVLYPNLRALHRWRGWTLTDKGRMSAMKSALTSWGISSFVAHEDIQASREWRDEVEAGLETMQVMVAVVQPGFKESDWCAQEVGYALGRKIDIIPVRAGVDPFVRISVNVPTHSGLSRPLAHETVLRG